MCEFDQSAIRSPAQTAAVRELSVLSSSNLVQLPAQRQSKVNPAVIASFPMPSTARASSIAKSVLQAPAYKVPSSRPALARLRKQSSLLSGRERGKE